MLNLRLWNIVFRTVHISVASGLFGGHLFGVESSRLSLLLYLTIFTGVCLVLLEAYPIGLGWLHEVRAILVICKLVLMCSIPWVWGYRVPILVAVLVIASVGSHMPRRYRHYSILYRRVMVQS